MVLYAQFNKEEFVDQDLKGKTIVCFVNDPGLATSHLPSPLFRGKNMTYYGRWTYKVTCMCSFTLSLIHTYVHIHIHIL
jgi:hypothetical protein